LAILIPVRKTPFGENWSRISFDILLVSDISQKPNTRPLG
jgi:hypothetical protein